MASVAGFSKSAIVAAAFALLACEAIAGAALDLGAFR